MHVHEPANGLLRGFRAAASLHCHTYHSKEMLNFIPHYASMIPIVSHLYKNEMERLVLDEKVIDFAKAYWTPPVSPRQVLEVETLHIEKELSLHALVSITDHDDIEAGLHLQLLDEATRVPISLEWTAPFNDGFFHLGVHNLPAQSANDIARELAKFTNRTEDAQTLTDLFALLNESNETLIVLNHPLWDLEYIGQEAHAENLGIFLSDYGHWIHALEVNGFRSWRENKAVIRMADDLGFPAVTGGDRHGCQANTMLNLTKSTSFDEFVAEIREDSLSEVIVMPEYRRSIVARMIEVVADVLRHYPNHSLGQPKWTDRIFVDLTHHGVNCGVQPLAQHWRRGGPAWVRASLWCLRMLGSKEIQPVLRLALANERIGYGS